MDLSSRSHHIMNTEWMLHLQVATHLWMAWGWLMMDLMATELTTQLPVYISLYPDPWAHEVHSMSCAWTGMDMYVFPPWAMLSEVLNKLLAEDCVVTLIAPDGRTGHGSQYCWACMLIDFLVCLPTCPDLLSMPHNGILHGLSPFLDLHACRSSFDNRLIRVF